MTLETAEELLGHRDGWPHLSESDLVRLALVGSWLVAMKDDEDLRESFAAFYAHVVENLDPKTRREAVADLGEQLEAFGREHGTCPVTALSQWLLSDPDFGVVSTAALIAAQVMTLTDEGPLTGPKQILTLALETTDSATQGAIVTGLAAFGDADILALIDASWEALDGDARSDVLLRMGSGPVTVAAIDFLVSRIERPGIPGWEGPIGHVVASLVQLREAASDTRPGHSAGGSVRDVDRMFPSWGSEEGESPIAVRRIYTAGEIGERIATPLQKAAADETYPRLLPLALRAWGAPDAAFIEGVRMAVGTLESAAPGALLDRPIGIEPLPDWDREDDVLTWGILNPFGPTKVQICRVSVSDDMDALVYTLHNPIAPVCFLLGTVASRDAAAGSRMLMELASRFHIGDQVLLKGLPHWVVTSADDDLDVPAFFRTAHTTALRRDLASDGDIENLILSLRRLRDDAQQEVHRQFMEAVQEARATPAVTSGGGASRRAPSSLEAYERWFEEVSDPGHVVRVSAHFLNCWNAARRLQRSAAALDPIEHGASQRDWSEFRS